MRGSVNRQPNGTWAFVVDVGVNPATGKRVQRRRRGFATKRAAEAELARIVDTVRRGAMVEPSATTLADFSSEWLDAIRPTVRPSTWEGYKQKLDRNALPHVGHVRLRDLDGGTLNGLYATLLAEGRLNGGGGGLSPRTVRHVHKILHRVLRDAVRWGRLERNPAESADPPIPADTEMQAWAPHDLRAFLEHIADDRLVALWTLAAMTGMRRGELLGLRWSDLELGNDEDSAGAVAIRQTLVSVRYQLRFSEPKTRRSRRRLPLDKATVAMLRRHRARQAQERLALGDWPDHDLVFTREDGSPIHPETLTFWFDGHVEAAELHRIRFHDVRHSYATAALAAGVHPKVVSERLGHSSVAITLDTYSHVVEGMQEEAAELVAGAILGGT